MKISYFVTHPIQYQAPMLRALHHGGIELETFFASDLSNKSHYDPGYARLINWEQALLNGYPFKVLFPKEHKVPRWRGFFRFFCRIKQQIDHNPPDVIWVHGWGNSYSLAAIIVALLRKIPLMIRGESQLRGIRGPSIWRYLHKKVLSRLFKHVSLFLTIGTANEKFYRSYGVSDEDMVRVPFATDNEFFQKQIDLALPEISKLRLTLDIPNHSRVVLFSGRLIREKDVPTLLNALALIKQKASENIPPITAIIVGDGPQRKELEILAEQLIPGQTRFVGFKSQKELPQYYALCDLMVLPSRYEPWGLVVNEVMNAGKVVIASDSVGSSNDLIRHGENGSIFRTGDHHDLATCIMHWLSVESKLEKAGRISLEIIENWSFKEDLEGLLRVKESLSDSIYQYKAEPNFGENVTKARVSVAYIGVHEAYQMAAAAAEANGLDRFYCSFFDAPGKWASLLGGRIRIPSSFPEGSSQIDKEVVREIPWPMILRRIKSRFPTVTDEPLTSNRWFQKLVIQQHGAIQSDIVVGSETCALDWFLHAKQWGARCVLDCHGIPAPFLDESLRSAAHHFSIAEPKPSDSNDMEFYKKQEREVADVIVCCSELQRTKWIELGACASKLKVVPLWVDHIFWAQSSSINVEGKRLLQEGGKKLRCVYAGACSLAKGVPYLLEAVHMLGQQTSLTLVGSMEAIVSDRLSSTNCEIEVYPYVAKSRLKQIYAEHDVLIMPSLGDSFGFVALEAMAAGLPVIVTDHCGVPVPSPLWRIPAHSSEAIETRLLHYINNPMALEEDAALAKSFARKFTPTKYRAAIQEVYTSLL